VRDTVVVGATKPDLVWTAEDENGDPIDLSGANAKVELQGHSGELPDADINEEGVVTDGPNGQGTWAQIGTFVADLGELASASYKLKVKFTDNAGLWDYGDEFTITWVAPPIVVV